MFGRIAYWCSVGLVLAEQAPGSAGPDWNNLGALGVLSIVVFWLLMKELPENRKAIRELASAIQDLKAHCVKNQEPGVRS